MPSNADNILVGWLRFFRANCLQRGGRRDRRRHAGSRVPLAVSRQPHDQAAGNGSTAGIHRCERLRLQPEGRGGAGSAGSAAGVRRRVECGGWAVEVRRVECGGWAVEVRRLKCGGWAVEVQRLKCRYWAVEVRRVECGGWAVEGRRLKCRYWAVEVRRLKC
eukprot:8940917-Pyramimonas_sp.AAC.2